MAATRSKNDPMAIRILDGLKNLWHSKELSDITLIAEGTSFSAHRTILALSSDYFMAMFLSPMVEASKDAVELKGVSAIGLDAILQYIYTGHLPISAGNICHIIMAASHLQMDAAMDVCTDIIHKVLNTTNCVDLKNISRLCSLKEIEYIVDDYIVDNFAYVMQEGMHCDLELLPLRLYYYSERSDDVGAILIGPEKKVFNLMLDWLKHEEERMADVEKVMEIIRFSLMNLTELAEITKQLPLLLENTACLRFMEEARLYQEVPPYQQVVRQTPKTRLRNNTCVLVLSQHPSTRKLLMHALCNNNAPLDPNIERHKAGEWLHLTDMEADIPNITLQLGSIASIVVNDFLIIVGVYEVDNDKQSPPSSCYLFDPRTGGWTKLADLNVGRYRTALVYFKEKLYALGGAASLTSLLNVDSVECYDFNDNTWREVARMPAKLRNHDACTSDDLIFICGGMREGGTLSYTVYLFDPITMSSQTNPPMLFACEMHKLCNIDNKIYMASPGKGVIRVYDRDSVLSWRKLWIRLGAPKIPVESHIVQVNNNLFFIDGVHKQSDSDSDSDSDYSITDGNMGGQLGYWSTDARHRCVEVVIGDRYQASGTVHEHEHFPEHIGSPLVAAGIRLQWHLTNRLLRKSTLK